MHTFTSAVRGLWNGLFDTNQSRWRYLGRALLADWAVTLCIIALLALWMPAFDSKLDKFSTPMLIFLTCFAAPVIETLFMMLFFAIIRRITQRMEYLVVISALLWAALHSATNLVHGIGIYWLFYLLSICYLVWEKNSRGDAFVMTTLFHSLHNTVPTIMVIISRT